jgi:prevent-host-death family protein
MKTEVGVYDARTRLHELLRQVKTGKRFTITNRGAAIADLVPSETARALDARAAIERFQAFLRDNPVKPGRKINTKSLIEEGRE